jgi:hypothetical protein
MTNIYGSGLYGAGLYSSGTFAFQVTEYLTYYGYAIPRPARVNPDTDSSIHLVQGGIGTTQGWGVDSDQQFMQAPYTPDKHLMDEGVEKVTLPFNDWVTDAYLQKTQLDPYTPDYDLSAASVELIHYMLTEGWDTDAENQMLQPIWYVWTPERDLLDTSVELVTYKLVKGWDTDSDQQLTQYLLNLWTPERDLLDSSVELIIGPPSASTQVVDTYTGYFIPKPARGDEAVGFIQFTVSISTFSENWVMDVENQIPFPLYTPDKDLTDSGVEYLTIKQGWDNDAENQLNSAYIATPNIVYGQFYNIDGDVSDPQVERITITSDWTPAEDNQISQIGYMVDRDVSDSGIELITYRLTEGWDTDSDNQLAQPIWFNDSAIDERNEFPIINVIVVVPTMEWDNDADQQLANPIWNVDKDLMDTGVELITTLPTLYTNTVSTYYGYLIPKPARAEEGAWTQFIVPTVVVLVDYTWDDDGNIPQQARPVFDDIDGIVSLIVPTPFTLDIEHQIPQIIWANDITEERAELFTFITVPVMQWDNDSEQQLQLQQNVRYLDEADIFIQLTTGWNDYDQNIAWPDQVKDDLNEQNRLPIVSFITQIDLDVEQQIPQALWITDYIDEKNATYLVFNVYDDIQERVWAAYNLDQIDEQNKYPLIQVMEIDNDTEQQFLQPAWYSDLIEERNELPIIPTRAIDLDVEIQIPQAPWQLDEVDTKSAFLFIPFDWTSDTENQLANPIWIIDNNLADEKVELITTLPILYTNTISTYYGYLIPKAARAEEGSWTQYPIAAVIPLIDYTWDNDSEQQLQWQNNVYQLDDSDVTIQVLTSWNDYDQNIPFQQALIIDIDLRDFTNYVVVSNAFDDTQEKVWDVFYLDQLDERNIYPIIPTQEIDNDAEYQFTGPSYIPDRDVDTGVEYLVYGPGVISAWDSASEFQYQQSAWQQDGDVTDASIEFISLPSGWDLDVERHLMWPVQVYDIQELQALPVTLPVIDLDADWQLPLMQFITDQLDERNLYPIIPIQEIDNDSEQQLTQAPWQLDETVSDVQVEIITLYNDWSTDTENQRVQDSYQLDRDVDTNVVFIFIPFDWGTDSENQLAQVIWANDIVEERNQYPIIVNAFDDIQDRVWDTYFDKDFADNVELITLPYVPWDIDDKQIQFNNLVQDYASEDIFTPLIPEDWNLNIENQFAWPQQVYDIQELQPTQITLPVIDLDTDWQLPLLQLAFDQIEERNLYPIIPIQEIDNDSEQQKLQPDWIKDHLSDEEVELIIIPPIVSLLYSQDTDADNQIPQALWYKDKLEDIDFTNYIVIPYTVQDDLQDKVWENRIFDVDESYAIRITLPVLDLDADWQLPMIQQAYDIQELQAFIVTYPVVDLDAEQQFAWTQLSIDQIEDRNMYPIIPIQEIDLDAEYQRQQDGYNFDKHLADESVEYITLPVMAWDIDSSIQSAAQYVFDTVDEFVQLILLPVQDLDVERQIPWPAQALDIQEQQALIVSLPVLDLDSDWQLPWVAQVYDIQELQALSIPLPVLDLDSEQQFQWLQLSTDTIEERNLYPIIPIREIDLDVELQLQQPDWYKDHLADEEVELIIIPPIVSLLYSQDTDAENQLAQPLWYKDKIEDIDFVNRIVIPFTVQDDLQDKTWDNRIFDIDESYAIQITLPVQDLNIEQQFPSLVFQGFDNVDESVLFTLIPVIEAGEIQFVSPIFVTFDNVDERVNVPTIPVLDLDAEQQFGINVFATDNVDERVSLVTPAFITVLDADDQQFVRNIFNVDSADELVLLPRIPLLDQDAENQKQWLDIAKDDLLDSAVEYITLPPLSEIEVTDADQQLSWIPQFSQDDLADSGVENITYPTESWDLEADWYIPHPKFTVDMDLLDTGVERITLPAPAWDTDADNQIPYPLFTPEKDLLDTGVELIQYVPGIIRDWDSDIVNQLPNPNWYIDYWEERDINQNVIPPTIIYVMIVYKVIAFALLDAYVNVIPQVALTNLSTALNMAVASCTAAPQMLLANITVTLKVTCKSVTNLSLGY